MGRRAGYFVVHDAGVERLVLLRRERDDARLTTQAIWDQSIPSFPAQYYSDNAGVAALCRAASGSPMTGTTPFIPPLVLAP